MTSTPSWPVSTPFATSRPISSPSIVADAMPCASIKPAGKSDCSLKSPSPDYRDTDGRVEGQESRAIIRHPVAATRDEQIRSQRRPALSGFIFRKLIAIHGLNFNGRQGVIETCRAECAWARADFTRIARDLGLDVSSHDVRYHGVHPAEYFRLPHERAAAMVLAADGDVIAHAYQLREGMIRLRAQREAGWIETALGTARNFRTHWANRRRSWKAYVAAVDEYRALRAAIDRPTSPAAVREAA